MCGRSTLVKSRTETKEPERIKGPDRSGGTSSSTPQKRAQDSLSLVAVVVAGRWHVAHEFGDDQGRGEHVATQLLCASEDCLQRRVSFAIVREKVREFGVKRTSKGGRTSCWLKEEKVRIHHICLYSYGHLHPMHSAHMSTLHWEKCNAVAHTSWQMCDDCGHALGRQHMCRM